MLKSIIYENSGGHRSHKHADPIPKKFVDFKGHWVAPDEKHIKDQLQLAACLFSINYDDLVDELLHSSMEHLTDKIWSAAKNTESMKAHSEDDAKQIADEYGYHYNDALIGYTEDREVTTPVILIKGSEDPWVISGEPELLFAKAYGITPKVIMIHLE